MIVKTEKTIPERPPTNDSASINVSLVILYS